MIYQVYPRSFQDSNGDGIGDLRGIEHRLDYFTDLGVNAIWISPVYPSPMVDFGYDVTDYCDIDSSFGNLADFDRLLAAAHQRNLKVILDFVPNHTSDQHRWFVESRTSRANPKRDWYIWRDPGSGGGPPNNWISDFGGSAWQWDEATAQYYLHAFLKEQPDLNWRTPAVRRAMYDVLRFWFARGVDGFRIDVLWHLIKAADFPDNPPNPAYHPGLGEMHRVQQLYSADRPEVHAIAGEMRQIADSFAERVLIGEVYLPLERLMDYYGRDTAGVHLPFNFQLLETPWSARALRAMIAAYESALPPGAWPNWVLGNHDRPRIATRVGEAQARVAAMLLLTLRGTPTIYYGDEVGLTDVDIPRAHVQDPRELREPGLGLGRDPVRTPMPWDSTRNAGFTSGAPWLPLNPDCALRNVACLERASDSMFSLYRELLSFRRGHLALSMGDFALMEDLDGVPNVLAYERSHGEKRLLIALNISGVRQEFSAPVWARGGRVSLSTSLEFQNDSVGERLVLRPDEGIIVSPRS